MNATGLIIGGKVVPCDLPVHNYNDHGLVFVPGNGARKRTSKKTIDLCVWHWTGGEGDYKALYSVLDTRDLGVEFYIGHGKIYQFADPVLVDTFDAGPYNPRSVGVEVRNYGFRADPKKIPAAGRSRPLYETAMNGNRRQFARFHPEDIAAAQALAKALSAAIPTIAPSVPTHEGRLYPDLMRKKALSGFSGHIGHYHISTVKSDPGHDLLQSFLDSGVCKGVEVF